MNENPKVLISGASIAGPALAYWLGRYGWRSTVVERASEFRDGGQNIDVRGAGREVLRRAGLEDAVRRANTGEVGTRFLGSGGSIVAEFPVRASESGGATAELEILRGDLARILVDASVAGDLTDYLYGDQIAGIVEGEDDVEVTFESGEQRRFDLVVAADGMRSSTRELVFGGEASVHPLGMETSYFTVPRTATDTPWWNWYNEAGGLAVTLRPDQHGTTRATLSSISYGKVGGSGRSGAVDARSERRTAAEQRARLREQFRDVGWEAPRLLDALDDASDLYFESIGQVKAPHWSRGRVALAGDAAWCASPVSGMGTSLSIVGAYVLAGELASHVHHRDAFAGYERIMRPYVDQAQQLPPGVPRVANPRTRAGLAALHVALRAASTPLVGKLGAKLFAPPADRIELPDYAHLERGRA
ncbi:FAD-binding monooxygenase [Subtercola boreus]|uniref:FAD-binding monooxygenase n=1 Tax=Subtercola boreus TaxID=120213 RepID=A0A3E0VK34_9MICO|nr:FAD-dependent monooxygenase [Subtercola boreus]RFA09813.1 FAD-binding monooxygenase [Subtercola boreus]TQL53069.1 2-polyprenyl-6-methoxyphenol hydroxylase-like FAD-dependent oxidoreductase [Subtercola boreus]